MDAVSIATPNHWHSLATIWACQAGKDVYVEKPISHNIFEGRKIKGLATHTLSQGKVVWADGDLRAVQGAGRYVKRPPFGPNFTAVAKRARSLKR